MQVVPAVRAIQDTFPGVPLTWVVGEREAELVRDLDGVDVVPIRKKGGMEDVIRLAQAFRTRRFSLLLHMHVSLRANLVSLAIPARHRVGYDRARSRDLHGLFVNRRIPPCEEEHVLDSFLAFARSVGARTDTPRWDVPVAHEDRDFARTHLPDGNRYLVISPCSSRPVRDWNPEGYAAAAAHAMERHGMVVVLCGGPSERERAMARRIEELLGRPVTNLVGKDTLKRLLAVLARATLVISPDSGPAHMASAVGTPVVGLFAATNPRRSGPYRSLRWCVDRFPDAARRFRGARPEDLPWNTKIEEPGVMELIHPPEVLERMDAALAGCRVRGGAVPSGHSRSDAAPSTP